MQRFASKNGFILNMLDEQAKIIEYKKKQFSKVKKIGGEENG